MAEKQGGKAMKKTMLGAVVLSAALAVGTTMPAFATGADGAETPAGKTTYTQDDVDGKVMYGVDDNYQSIAKGDIAKDMDGDGEKDGVATIDDQTEGNSSTPVYIATNIAQINVAVPTKLVFVAESIGGPMMAPSDGVYEIQNYTTKAAIYITDIKAADSENNNGDWVVTDDNTKVGAGVESDATRAHIMMQMASEQDVEGHSASFTVKTDGTNLLTRADNSVIPLKIEAASESGATINPASLGFSFDGVSSVVNDARTANGQEIQAFNLLYTIGTSGK